MNPQFSLEEAQSISKSCSFCLCYLAIHTPIMFAGCKDNDLVCKSTYIETHTGPIRLRIQAQDTIDADVCSRLRCSNQVCWWVDGCFSEAYWPGWEALLDIMPCHDNRNEVAEGYSSSLDMFCFCMNKGVPAEKAEEACKVKAVSAISTQM